MYKKQANYEQKSSTNEKSMYNLAAKGPRQNNCLYSNPPPC